MKKLKYNLETGEAIITKWYNLLAKYVIQTVGSIIENEVTKEKNKIRRKLDLNPRWC